MPVAAIIYAAKSTEDPNGSIETQLQDGRKIAAERGWTVEGEFQDKAKSAYMGNRGVGLEDAMRRCEELAPCQLIVQHSDRIARGDGDAAKHLVEYAIWARRHKVEIVSVQDPQTFGPEGLVYAALMGDRNFEDSKRKQAAIRDGMHRMFERGEWPGRTPDGYKLRKVRNEADQVVAREIIKDPDMEPTMERMFGLALEGLSPATIARSLNGEGHRNANGGVWTRGDVKRVLENPFHAGVMVYGGVEKTGTYATYIDLDQHKEIAERMAHHTCAAGHGRVAPGRRAIGHLLNRLAVCDRCGARMYAESQSYTRKDGTHKRMYTCSHHRHADGMCTVQVDAVQVDGRVIEWLDELMADFEGWRRKALSNVEAQRIGAQKRLDEVLAELDEIDRMAGLIEADYLKAIKRGDDGDFYARQSEKMATRRRNVERTVEMARVALAEFEEPAVVDAMLDLVGHLRQPTVEETNEALRAEFDSFRIAVDEHGIDVIPVPRHTGPVIDLAAEYAAYKGDLAKVDNFG